MGRNAPWVTWSPSAWRRLRGPETQGAVLGSEHEVFVGREKRQPVVNAQLDQQCIDGPDLYAGTATGVSHLCRGDVVIAVRLQQRQRRKALDDLRSRHR